jgi:hypothetical protein
MNELTRLSQTLIDELHPRRSTVIELNTRSRRRHVRQRSFVAGALAIVLVAAFGVVRIEHSPSTPMPPSVQLAAYYEAAINVPESTLASVGLPATVAVPTKVTPSLSTVATNSEVSYVGAEYCPYCAFQRWALLVALSKFGTFTQLDNETYSSSSDVYPHLASWSFVGAKYSSKYFTFHPTELTSSTPSKSGGYTRLERMTAAQRVAFDKYNPQGSLPFVDIGNEYVAVGASSSPSVLEGLTLAEIGSDLNSPSSSVARAVDGSANYLIAALCTIVQKTPPALCSEPVIRAATKAIQSGVPPSSVNANTYPTQPPANAPLEVWKKWSVAEHKFWLHAAATFRSPTPGCTVIKISVTGRKLTKPLLGIPAGVWLWGMGLIGHCPPDDKNGLVQRRQ